ncbi:MAG: hypothetical protein J7641_23205 [Cyanobacteria bacterium SID2]|nr:hypothetical protein [Cyanobacteria bacterium SID2]MBP0005955.1 hypothetical protein [Cyanobacteria bacterium SBC]
MTARLSLLRNFVAVSVCLLVALLTIVPPALVFSELTAKSATLHFPQPYRSDLAFDRAFSRGSVDGLSSKWVELEPLTFINLLFATPTAEKAFFELGEMDLVEAKQGLLRLGDTLDRLLRLFWTFAQRWQTQLQQPGVDALLEVNFPVKGEDMLETAA